MNANIGRENPTRLITETEFLEFVKDLLNIVKEGSQKLILDAEEMSRRTKDKADLQWYFRDYKKTASKCSWRSSGIGSREKTAG